MITNNFLTDHKTLAGNVFLYMGLMVDMAKKWHQEIFTQLRKPNWIEMLVSLVLLTGGVFLTLFKFKEEKPLNIILMYIILLLGSLLGIFFWMKFTHRFFRKLLNLIAINKFAKIFVSGGSITFKEYQDPEMKEVKAKFTQPIGLTISSTITFLGIAVTIIGILRKITDIDLSSALVWTAIGVLTPILSTPLLPVVWAMDDAKIKAWSEKNHTAWTVASKYKRRFNSILSITAIFSNLNQGVTEQGFEQIKLLGDIIFTGMVVMFIPVGLLVFFYYSFFRSYLRRYTSDIEGIDTYKIQLVKQDGNTDTKTSEVEEKEDEGGEAKVTNEKVVNEKNTMEEKEPEKNFAEKIDKGKNHD